MCIAIIVAGGKGKRMKSKVNKILLSLEEKPVIYHTIKKFQDCSYVEKIILVVNEDNFDEIQGLAQKYKFDKVIKIVRGGKERQDSVYNGIKAIENAEDDEAVLIHNAANPFVSEQTIKDVINTVKEHGAAAAALPSEDTLKEVDKDGFVLSTLDRNKIWRMQTPQGMKYRIAKKAFSKAYEKGYCATDDVALVERIGKKVKIVETNKENIKITTPEDLVAAEKIVKGSRIGLGQDSHKFIDEKQLKLGGILIEHEKGLEGNSDGDVILHALFNAFSQAIGMRSIGCYADDMCLEQGITDSREYLKFIYEKVKEKGYAVNNIGIMVEALKPRMEKYHDKIKESISKLIGCEVSQIGLTFTSGEELTSFGRGEGMQCFVVVTLSKV